MEIETLARSLVGARDLRVEPEFPHDIWRAMGEAGLFRIGLDPTHGGAGGGYAGIAAAETALIAGTGFPGLGGAFAAHQMVARYFIAQFGTGEQCARLLPALANGRSTASVAISEPGAGAHPKHLRTTAEHRGNAYVLTGEKAYLTNGPIADLFVVFAITAVTDGRKRYSAFLVPAETPGVERVPMPDMPALRPALHCGLRLADCAVPEANRLGPADDAYERMALPFRDIEDAVGTAGTVGSFRAVLRQLGAIGVAEDAGELGAMAALIELMAVGSAALVAALDATHAPPGPALVGVRVLAAEVLARARQFGDARGGDARLAALLDALGISLGVARTARLARQAQLGAALLRAHDGAAAPSC